MNDWKKFSFIKIKLNSKLTKVSNDKNKNKAGRLLRLAILKKS